MFEKKNKHKKMYGYYPIKYIGNYEPLRNLNADYSSTYLMNLIDDDRPIYNYNITGINFVLSVNSIVNNLYSFNIKMYVTKMGESPNSRLTSWN